MASKRNLIIAIAALALVIVAAAIAYNALAPTVETQTLRSQGDASQSADAEPNAQATAGDGEGAGEERSQAPDFAMTTPDGEEVTLASLEGKPLVLNFWASTCGPCKGEMPEFQSAYEEYGDRIEFAMVNIPDFNGETRERALQFVADQGYTFPVYFDDAEEAQVAYGITSIPQTYFIAADGKVEAYASGAISASVLERGLSMIL